MSGVLILSGCTADDRTDGTVQYQDTSFTVPDAGEPTYETGLGPVVGIDEAHHNYHRVDGRYRSFAEVLRADGYSVGASTSVFSVDALNTLDVLVISNALAEEKEEEWSLPTPAAFTADEVEAAEAWIRRGGRLMLIADHMPMPGAAENLALAFGVVFHDGYAFNADSTHTMVFSKESGQLADHVVTRDEGGGEIPFVVTFTGQAFRILPEVIAHPLFLLADDSYVLLPTRAWDFDQDAPRIPGAGLLQGALVEHGEGRVAFFGEAAAFSAQIQEWETGPIPFGMNAPEARHNARFLLNVMRWLSG